MTWNSLTLSVCKPCLHEPQLDHEEVLLGSKGGVDRKLVEGALHSSHSWGLRNHGGA